MTTLGDSAKVRSEAIADLEMALGRFANTSVELAKAAEATLRRTTAELEERRSALRSELARLQDEIDEADEEDDTGYLRRQYEETDEALSNVIRWQRNVEVSAVTYLRESARLRDLSTGMTVQARADLRRALDNLRAYFALQYDADGAARESRADPVDLVGADAGGAGARRFRALASLLISLPALRSTAWDNLTTQNERLEVLQEVENRSASLVGRPALPVLPAVLGPGECGLCDGETIWINEDYLEPGFSQEMVRTIIHEGRHAYQYHVCNNPTLHGDLAEVNAWRWNLSPGHYIEWRENPPRYMSQPVEADAFAYEEAVMEAYLSEGGY